MKRLIKQIMIAALVAVAMLGGGELPILHAPQFAEAHALAHQQMHDAAALDHATLDHVDGTHDHASNVDDGNSAPAGSDHGCNHVHAHCCAATAIIVTVQAAPPAATLGQVRIAHNGAIPYGQLSNPPLRPPRLTA